MASQIALAGSVKSGKTTYLAALLRAVEMGRSQRRVFAVRPAPNCRASLELALRATSILMGQNPPASQEVTRYDMIVRLPGSVVGNIGGRSSTLSAIDAPGTVCLPSPHEDLHLDMLRLLVEANKVMFLISCGQESASKDVVNRIRALVDRVRSAKGLSIGQPAFNRLAVVLTKCELLAGPFCTNAFKEVDHMEPHDVARMVLGHRALKIIEQAVPPGGEAYFLVSAFGFQRSDGRLAAERIEDGWRLKPSPRGFFDGWWPYRIFEPLEFLLRGIANRQEMVLSK